MKENLQKNISYGENLSCELCELVDEFKSNIGNDPIQFYYCGKETHYSKLDLTGKLIKKYADFKHTHESVTSDEFKGGLGFA